MHSRNCIQESLLNISHEVGNVLDIASATGHPHGGLFVPQKTYRPHTISDRRRYVDEVELEAPILFFSNKPVGCGILLRDAISSRFSTLEGRDDAMFQGRGPSVSIRLNVRYSFQRPRCDAAVHLLMEDVNSGRATRPGVGRSRPETSVARLSLSHGLSWLGMWQRQSNVSFR